MAKDTSQTTDLYDVVAINIKTTATRVIASGKTKPNADAILAMAVMRRGVEEEFLRFCRMPDDRPQMTVKFIKRERGDGFHRGDISDCEICRKEQGVPPEFQWDSASKGWRSPEEPIDGD